jgi:hypothetical protein
MLSLVWQCVYRSAVKRSKWFLTNGRGFSAIETRRCIPPIKPIWALVVRLRWRGRQLWLSGHLTSTALVVANYLGQRYLVSMLGDGSEWVRNIRAANGDAFIKTIAARRTHRNSG